MRGVPRGHLSAHQNILASGEVQARSTLKHGIACRSTAKVLLALITPPAELSQQIDVAIWLKLWVCYAARSLVYCLAMDRIAKLVRLCLQTWHQARPLPPAAVTIIRSIISTRPICRAFPRLISPRGRSPAISLGEVQQDSPRCRRLGQRIHSSCFIFFQIYEFVIIIFVFFLD